MGNRATQLARLVQQLREQELRNLPPKELRKLMYKRRAGLSPIGKITATKDSILAIRIFLERQNLKRMKNQRR